MSSEAAARAALPNGGRATLGIDRRTWELIGLCALVLLAPVAVVYLSFNAGGYFPNATGFAAVVFAQALILRRADGPDLIRHQPTMPEVDGPHRSPATGQVGLLAPGSEIRVEGGVDTWDPDGPVGPAELAVWVRLPAIDDDPVLAQALLAYGTDGFLIGTALRPHAGFGQNMAHRSLATGVVSHTLTFHERVEVGTWLLMAQESPYAGRGVSYGRSHVFSEDGRLIASFVQESMIKDAAPTPPTPPTPNPISESEPEPVSPPS